MLRDKSYIETKSTGRALQISITKWKPIVRKRIGKNVARDVAIINKSQIYFIENLPVRAYSTVLKQSNSLQNDPFVKSLGSRRQ
jgi:hypothetical protein